MSESEPHNLPTAPLAAPPTQGSQWHDSEPECDQPVPKGASGLTHLASGGPGPTRCLTGGLAPTMPLPVQHNYSRHDGDRHGDNSPQGAQAAELDPPGRPKPGHRDHTLTCEPLMRPDLGWSLPVGAVGIGSLTAQVQAPGACFPLPTNLANTPGMMVQAPIVTGCFTGASGRLREWGYYLGDVSECETRIQIRTVTLN